MENSLNKMKINLLDITLNREGINPQLLEKTINDTNNKNNKNSIQSKI